MAKDKKAAEEVEVKEVKVETVVEPTVVKATDKPIGNPDPITGNAHDCEKDFKFRSINVSGKAVRECSICGARS